LQNFIKRSKLSKSFTFASNYWFSAISIIISLQILLNYNNLRNGLEMLFLLPFFFGLLSVYLLRIYQEGGIGLKTFFIILCIRYLLVPLLISLTNGEFNTLPVSMPMINASSIGYQYAVFVSIIELIISAAFINYFVHKLRSRLTKRKEILSIKTSNLGLSFFGFIALTILVILLFTRDISKLMSTFSFLTIEDKYIDAVSDPFGILISLTIKMFAFILITTYCYKLYLVKRNPIWVLISIAIAFVNMSIYFGYNRSFVLQTGIVTIYVLYTTYPKYRRMFILGLAPAGILIMLSMIFIKQFGVSYFETTLSDQLNLSQISNTIECYVGGPWSLASGFDAAINASFQPVETFIKDFILNFFVFYLPGFEWVLNIFPDIVSSTITHNVYTYSFQMLPLAANTLFYGGIIMGIPISISMYCIILKILVLFDYRSMKSIDIGNKYIYSLIAILLSFVMCYTWVTLIWSFSKNILWIVLLLFINKIHLSRNGIIYYKKVY